MGGGISKYGVAYGSKLYKALKRNGDNRPRADDRRRFIDFGSGYDALQKSSAWFADPNNTNSKEWLENLPPDSQKAISDYTGEYGISYHEINSELYKTPWEKIPSSVKERIEAMDKAMDNTILSKGMQVTRQADFKIFGAKSHEKMTEQQIKDFILKNGKDNTLTNLGYLSTGANNHGAAIDGSGLVIHFKVPPSIGAGAYINPISKHASAGENEFLFNRSSMFKFDLNSIHTTWDGKVHINARWVGLDKKKKKRK